jgi:hypothetical protein
VCDTHGCVIHASGSEVYWHQQTKPETQSGGMAWSVASGVQREVREIVRTCGEDGISLDDERRQERWKKTDKCVWGGGRHIIG